MRKYTIYLKLYAPLTQVYLSGRSCQWLQAAQKAIANLLLITSCEYWPFISSQQNYLESQELRRTRKSTGEFEKARILRKI